MSGVPGASLVTGHTVEHTYTHGTPTPRYTFLSSPRERILRSQLINHRARERERERKRVRAVSTSSATYISFPPKIESSTLLPHSYHSSPSPRRRNDPPKTRPFRSRCHTARERRLRVLPLHALATRDKSYVYSLRVRRFCNAVVAR
jgi:hypothetical protein